MSIGSPHRMRLRAYGARIGWRDLAVASAAREGSHASRLGQGKTTVHLDLASALNLVSTICIVGALVFTGLQVRAANRTRQDQAAIAVIQTTQSENWTRALSVVSALPPGATLDQVVVRGAAVEQALFELSIRLETIGYMVFRRLVPLATIDDLIGGIAVVFWSRARLWTQHYRTTTHNLRFNEWCEWLADRLAERREHRSHEPAHELHRRWLER